jgi:hypothetical protein
VTVYRPGAVNACFGFTSLLDVPSPKFHEIALIVPVDWLMNWTLNGTSPDALS